MKLYYSPAACSLAPHIALEESGLSYEIVRVDLRTHRIANGIDFYTINPKGYVPVLELDNGEHLTEVADPAVSRIATPAPLRRHIAPSSAIAQWWPNPIATKNRGLKAAGTLRRQRRRRQRAFPRQALDSSKRRSRSTYLTGDGSTIADAYLFTVVNWSGAPVDSRLGLRCLSSGSGRCATEGARSSRQSIGSRIPRPR